MSAAHARLIIGACALLACLAFATVVNARQGVYSGTSHRAPAGVSPIVASHRLRVAWSRWTSAYEACKAEHAACAVTYRP
jgi:hypothetical protein